MEQGAYSLPEGLKMWGLEKMTQTGESAADRCEVLYLFRGT